MAGRRGRAPLPATARRPRQPSCLHEIGGRHDDVGCAAAQVDLAVTVAVDAFFEIVLGQDLGLADLAGPGALDVGRQVPRSISFSSAISCGRNSSGRRQSCDSVASASSVLKSPCTAPKSVSSAQNAATTGGGTPYSRLGAREHVGIFLEVRRALLQAVGVDHAAGEFDEGLGEHALRAVALDHVRIDRGVVERLLALAGRCLPARPRPRSPFSRPRNRRRIPLPAPAPPTQDRIEAAIVAVRNPMTPSNQPVETMNLPAGPPKHPSLADPMQGCPWQNTGAAVQSIILCSPSTTFSRPTGCR